MQSRPNAEHGENVILTAFIDEQARTFGFSLRGGNPLAVSVIIQIALLLSKIMQWEI